MKFARTHAFTVLASIPPIVEPMEKTMKTKPKSSATKNEVEQNEDMIRGTLRAIEKLLKIDGADTCAVSHLPFSVVLRLAFSPLSPSLSLSLTLAPRPTPRPQPLQDFVQSVCESDAFKPKWDAVVADANVGGEA